jgi:drug/metabolite transporter (DMT)-like permease
MRTFALLSLIAATIVWGATFPLVKRALADSGPLTFLALRFCLAAVIMLPVLRSRGLRNARSWTVALCGVALFAGYALQTVGLATTTPARSAFLTAFSIVLIPLLEPLAGVNPLAWRSVVGALLALAGLAVLLHPQRGAAAVGDLLTLGCAVAFACHGLLLQAAVRRAPAAAVNAVQVVITGLLALPFATAEGWRFTLTPRLLIALLVTAVLATAAAFAAMTYAQRVLTAAQTAVVLACEPVVAGAVSVALGEDAVSAGLVLGGVLVAAGVALAAWRGEAALKNPM